MNISYKTSYLRGRARSTNGVRFITKTLYSIFYEKICIIDYFYVYTSKKCDINHHISIFKMMFYISYFSQYYSK